MATWSTAPGGNGTVYQASELLEAHGLLNLPNITEYGCWPVIFPLLFSVGYLVHLSSDIINKNNDTILHRYGALYFSECVYRMVLADPHYLVREAGK